MEIVCCNLRKLAWWKYCACLMIFHFKSFTFNPCMQIPSQSQKSQLPLFNKGRILWLPKKNLSNAASSFLYNQQSRLVVTLLHCVSVRWKLPSRCRDIYKDNKRLQAHIKGPLQKRLMSYFDWGRPGPWQPAAMALPHSCLYTPVPRWCRLETSEEIASTSRHFYSSFGRAVPVNDFSI